MPSVPPNTGRTEGAHMSYQVGHQKGRPHCVIEDESANTWTNKDGYPHVTAAAMAKAAVKARNPTGVPFETDHAPNGPRSTAAKRHIPTSTQRAGSRRTIAATERVDHRSSSTPAAASAPSTTTLLPVPPVRRPDRRHAEVVASKRFQRWTRPQHRDDNPLTEASNLLQRAPTQETGRERVLPARSRCPGQPTIQRCKAEPVSLCWVTSAPSVVDAVVRSRPLLWDFSA